jgi:hypothetical protein
VSRFKLFKTIALLLILILGIGYAAAAENTIQSKNEKRSPNTTIPEIMEFKNPTKLPMELDNKESGYVLRGLMKGIPLDVLVKNITTQRELNKEKKWYTGFYEYFNNNDKFIPYRITVKSY